MSRASGGPVPTFSIRFQEQGYDESPFSRLVADRYSTDHHEFVVRNEGFDIDILQAMITHHGQPTADTSAVPTFMVSRLARQFVKVVLSGDGGDECFGGYTHFGWAQDIDRLYAVLGPYGRRSRSSPQAGTLKASEPGRRAEARAKLSGCRAGRSFPGALEVLRLNDGAAIDAILTPEWCREHDDRPTCLETFLSDLPPGDPVRQSQEFAFRYVLPDAYLAKVDRMSMASALEVRVPFLDHRLVEFCLLCLVMCIGGMERGRIFLDEPLLICCLRRSSLTASRDSVSRCNRWATTSTSNLPRNCWVLNRCGEGVFFAHRPSKSC